MRAHLSLPRIRWAAARLLIALPVTGFASSCAGPRAKAPVVTVGEEPPSAAHAPASPDGVAERPDPEAYFEERQARAKKTGVKRITVTNREMEASDRAAYWFDARLGFRYFTREWSSEGSGGDAVYVVEDGALVCMRETENSPDPGPHVIVFCTATGGLTYDEMAAARGDDAGHAITTGEYQRLLEGARTAFVSFSIPEANAEGSCSMRTEGVPQTVGEYASFTPVSELTVPRELCEHTDVLVEAVQSVQFTPG